MAHPVLLSTLVTRCQQRGVAEGDGSVDTNEVKELISDYYGELHALVTEKGADYFQTEVDVDLGDLALPADHMTTMGVDFVLSGTTGPRRPVFGPITSHDRTRLVGLTIGGPAYFFGLEGANLALYPITTSGTYKHLYVPQPTDLSTAADGTAIDTINIYGERLIKWGVASVILHKGSAAQDRAVNEHDRAAAQLEYWACQRVLQQPSYRVPPEFWCGWRWPR